MITEFQADHLISSDIAKSLTSILEMPGTLLSVAETLKAQVPKQAFCTLLSDQFSFTPAAPSQAHLNLLALNPPLILTTNYDRLIECAIAYLSHNAPTVVTYSNPVQVRNALLISPLEMHPQVFKLHGDVNDPSNIILTSTDYLRLQLIEEGYRLLLTSLFLNYTTLFIGFSLTDPEIMLHIENVQESMRGERLPDYALMSADSCSENDAVTFRRDYGIQIIRYENKDGTHSAIDTFLSLLANP